MSSTKWAGNARRATIAGLVTSTAALVGVGALLPGSPATAGGSGAGGWIHCQESLCVRYAPLSGSEMLLDSDGDGYSDADERATGTDPYDPGSHPGVPELVATIAHGELPSFERQFTEVLVLPEKAPDGTMLGGATTLASLTEALGALAPSRKDAMSRLGISGDLLSQFGVTGADVVSMVAGPPTKSGTQTFDVRVGGIAIGLISADSGTGVWRQKNEDGSTRVQVTWFEGEPGDTTSVSVYFDLDENGVQLGSGVTTSHKGETSSCESTLSQLVECGGEAGKKIDEGYKKLKEAEKRDASPKPATPPPTPQAPPPSGSSQPSSQPSASATAEPSASASPSGGTYTNPDADGTVVVLTADSVRETIRLIRGQDTTPVVTDEPRPDLDPERLKDPNDPYAYWEGPRSGLVITTTAPILLDDPYTNHGDPNGPLGDKPTGAPQ